MLHLPRTANPSQLSIPRSDSNVGGHGPLTLRLEKGGNVYEFPGLIDTRTDALYYIVTINGTDTVPVGEYDYTLTSATDGELSCGILILGDYEREVKAVSTERKVKEYGG